MSCQLCGKRIGPVRRWVDGEFCSAAHRREAAHDLDRSLGDLDDDSMPRRGTSRLRAWPTLRAVMGLLSVMTLVLVAGVLSFSNVMASGRRSASDPNRGFRWSMQSVAPVTHVDDARAFRKDWVPGMVLSTNGLRHDFGAGEFRFTNQGISPGTLYLWKPSLGFRNYEFSFLATLDQRSIGFAFRGSDAGSFYGAKLMIVRDGDGPNACLERIVRQHGTAPERVCLPVPVVLEPGQEYHVKVQVYGDQFVVAVDEEVVAWWSDHRLPVGGIGFFSEENEAATVRDVVISERDSLLGRLISYFTFIRPRSSI